MNNYEIRRIFAPVRRIVQLKSRVHILGPQRFSRNDAVFTFSDLGLPNYSEARIR